MEKNRWRNVGWGVVGTIALVGCSSTTQFTSQSTPTVLTADGTIHIEPIAVAPELRNEWTPALEAEFWQRANQTIQHYQGQDYGNTHQENEKRSYPLAMFDFLAGERQRSLQFLQSEDTQANDHAHTEGIDYYFAFALKGQIRKYFFFGQWLDPAYRVRMRRAARQWTEIDPVGRPHPLYGMGNSTGEDWSIRRRGGWVDSRNTDNLRAMREVAVYLMAEETGNEAVRQRYKDQLQRYVRTLYHIGMGEWDSSTYHGHTFAAYLNLYDFARDLEVKQTAKAALDWLSTAAAVKYYRGGWAAPSKRDYNDSNVVFGAAASRFFWLYFGDVPVENPQPERDLIHAITSAYRPPQAIVALARKQFDRPVELLSSKPIYQNWLAGGDVTPAYWETTFFGETYQLGSVVSAFADGDVHPFKLVAQSQRGIDGFVVNTGGERVRSGKHPGDQLGQYRNLLIWLRPTLAEPFFFQLPKPAAIEIESGIWFIQLEHTWLAIHPIHLSPPQPHAIEDERYLERYPDQHTFVARAIAGDYTGFALEVGEPQSHGSYNEFKQRVKATSQLDLGAIATGTVHLTSSSATTLQLTHNSLNMLPTVERNGTPHNWLSHRDLYTSPDDPSPVSLGWKQGNLRVEADGKVFESELF